MKPYLAPLILLCGTFFLGYLYVQDPVTKTQWLSKPSGKTVPYTQLQQYRQETEVKLDIESQRAALDNRLSGPNIDPSARPRKQFHKTEVQRARDPRAFDLEDDVDSQALGLDQRMDEFLAKKQQYEDLAQSQKRAYVRSFIEEARKMGFVVVVNNQMEVESVTPVDSASTNPSY